MTAIRTDPQSDTLRQDVEHAARNAACTADSVRFLIETFPVSELRPLLDRLCQQNRDLILMVNPRASGIAPAPRPQQHRRAGARRRLSR